MKYAIRVGIPIPKKQRSLKYKWDIDVINTVVAKRVADPSVSWMRAIYSTLEDTLTEDQLIDVDIHYKRVYDRIKLTYPDVE